MKQQLRIAIIYGTNREGAYSLRLAENLEVIVNKAGHTAQLLDLKLLPVEIFKSASYEERPGSFKAWQQSITESDGLIFCIPEYNGGVPGSLKYFMDMLEYPGSFMGRPICLLGLSAGHSGATNALGELERLLIFQKANLFGDKVSIPRCTTEIASDGKLQPALLNEITGAITSFLGFCTGVKPLPSPVHIAVPG
jgi:chromate reductase, NAD(P)H dehydrogenase (quinone)